MKKIVIIGLLVMTVFILLFLIYYIPIIQVDKYLEISSQTTRLTPQELATLENNFRATLASALGGLGLLIGLWITYQRLYQADRNAKSAEANVRIIAKAQNLDRLTTALEYLSTQLTSKKIAGLTIIGNLALDYPEEVLPVTQTLLHYLPERIPFREPAEAIPADIFVALSQISKINMKYEKEIEDILLFTGCALQHGLFQDLFLANSVFRDINLEDATFYNCTFTNSIFISANTYAIKFDRCTLSKVTFHNVDLTFSSFQKSNCVDVNFSYQSLEGGALASAKFKNCIFQGVNFKNASLHNTKFEGCIMAEANLKEADFVSAEQLTGAMTLYETRLPEQIHEDLNREFPHLFEPPKLIILSDLPFYKLSFFLNPDGVYRAISGELKWFDRISYGVSDDSYETIHKILVDAGYKVWP